VAALPLVILLPLAKLMSKVAIAPFGATIPVMMKHN
jgi:hypothetical protein